MTLNRCRCGRLTPCNREFCSQACQTRTVYTLRVPEAVCRSERRTMTER